MAAQARVGGGAVEAAVGSRHQADNGCAPVSKPSKLTKVVMAPAG